MTEPEIVVEGDPTGFYYLLLERRTDGLEIDGDVAELERLLDAIGAPARVATPAPTA